MHQSASMQQYGWTFGRGTYGIIYSYNTVDGQVPNLVFYHCLYSREMPSDTPSTLGRLQSGEIARLL